MIKNQKRGLLKTSLVMLGGCLCFGAATQSLAERLPVFKLQAPSVEHGKAERILASLSEGRVPPGLEKQEMADKVVHRAGKKEVEMDKRSGGVFVRDAEKLWNPAQKTPELPSQAQAKAKAEKFLAENKLLPKGKEFPRGASRSKFRDYSETAAIEDAPNAKKRTLDVQVNYGMEIALKAKGGKERVLPVVGGGGKFKVAVGDRGDVIGFAGTWREIERTHSEEEILSKEAAEAKFKKGLGDSLKLARVESELAYYSAPAFEKQEYLAPVWVVRGEVEVDGETIPLRNTIIAATQYGPKYEPGPPPIPRGPQTQPDPRAIEEGDETPGGRQGFLDWLISPAWANPAYEFGVVNLTSSYGGLPGCEAVGRGFRDRLSAAGWQQNFWWQGAAAFESDWNRNDDYYVDAADIVFYCGHASKNGWSLYAPDDSSLYYTEVGTTPGNPNDLYGQNDLEWIIIAACGPLQSSHFTTNVNNAFDRWRGIFDGLHILMGYGAVTYDNTREGSRFAELALAGWPLIDAWFRTAWEIQPSYNGYSPPNGPRIYVTAMYAHTGDHATRNDHLWGKGSVAVDAVGSSQQRYLMWSGT